MKRKYDLYEETYKIEHIMHAFDEVCRNTRNRRKVNKFKDFRCMYISIIYHILAEKTYRVGPYNVFTIYEPKKRRIVSQGMIDKIVNHLVARHILMPSVIPGLIDQNVASRVEMGTQKGIAYLKKYRNSCACKYEHYYILKCDISSFFASIDQQRLKEKLKRRIKEPEALKIVFDIIDSEEQGLGIGNMTSQILAIFYLNDLDHYIKETLKIEYYIRYQDDFLLMHPSKEYLKVCLVKIKQFLDKEKLKLNKKTRLYKDTDNFIFLGRSLDGKYARYREIYRRLKKRKYLYSMGSISLMSYASSIASYQYLNGGRLNMKRIRTRLMNSRAGAINICRILSHDFSCILKKCVYNINYS